jgi:hypothetical protein
MTMKKSALDMMQRTVALVVTFGGIGNRRKVSTSQIEVEADKEWLSVSKKLIEADELEAIHHLDAKIKSYLDTRALPSLFKRGIFLLPISLVEEVNVKLSSYSHDRRMLVDALVKVYTSHVKEAKIRLRDLYNEQDYPTKEQLRAAFTISWQFTSFNTPAALNQISRELYEAEKAKAEACWVEAREAIQQLLRANMQEMVNHLVDKLSPGEEGKKKIFRDTAVSKFQEFLQTFDARNVTDDAQLKKLVDQAKNLLEGVDPQVLRSNEGARDSVRAGFEKIKAAIDPMIVVKPRRAIQLDDEAA